jgi:hypothetical protein
MFHTYIGTLSGVFVVLADSGMGKSEAAMYFMKSLRPQSPDRGIMVGGERHQCYGSQLAEKLKAPPSRTNGFALTLSAALISTVPEKRNVSLLKRLLDGIGECSGSQSILEEGVDATLVEDHVGDLNLKVRRLLPTGEAPVLILDDFSEDSAENRDFIYALAIQASFAKQVVFVLTHNKKFANELVRLNGWEKIMSLEGIYNPLPHKQELLEKEKDPKNFDCFSDPDWFELPWSVEMLKEMLITKFPELKNMPLPFLREGMKPSEAIKEATLVD